MAAPSSLDDLRQRIDAIDTQLHDLIMERAGLAEPIARLKQQSGDVSDFMRPGREAIILRRLLARHQGALPPSVILRLWRELINANLYLESGLSLHVYSGRQDTDLWDLARGHYGFLSPITIHHNPVRLVRAVAETDGAVGLMPVPAKEDDEAAWWRPLMTAQARAPRIVGRLPFLIEGVQTAEPAYVLARVAPDPSGDDTTLISVVTDPEVSRSWIDSRLASHGFQVTCIASRLEAGDSPARLHLYEAKGAHPSTDERLAAMGQDRDSGIQMTMVIGLYANPIRLTARGADAGQRAE